MHGVPEEKEINSEVQLTVLSYEWWQEREGNSQIIAGISF